MLNYIILIFICVLILVVFQYRHTEHYSSDSNKSTYTSPFYSPIAIERTVPGQCKPVPITDVVCKSYNASNEKMNITSNRTSDNSVLETTFTEPVLINKTYLCKTNNCVFSDLTKRDNYNEIFPSMSTRFENGFDDLVSTNLLNSTNSTQPPSPDATLQGKVDILKDKQIQLKTAQNNFLKTSSGFNDEGIGIWNKYCMNTQYDTLAEPKENDIFKTDNNISNKQKICGQLQSLFQPIRISVPFVVRAKRGKKASGGQYGFIEVVPYGNLVSNNLVWTDRQIRFVPYPGGDSKFIHPTGQFVPEKTYYIRSANNDKNTSVDNEQIILWVNKPVTVFIELWMQSRKQIGVNTWCNEQNGWENTGLPLAHWKTPIHNAKYYATLDSGHLFQQGIYYRQFKAGSTISLMGNDGDGTGSYYVFVSNENFSTSADLKNSYESELLD